MHKLTELDMLIDDELLGVRPVKISRTDPNVANKVAEHLAHKWHELAYSNIDGVWFTGSQVWSFIYNEPPQASHDTDIYCEDEATYEKVIFLMGWEKCPTVFKNNTRSLQNTEGWVSKGRKIETMHGNVDIWYTEEQLPIEVMLAKYPKDSHSHCMTAYSFTQGLVVLPNTNGWSK